MRVVLVRIESEVREEKRVEGGKEKKEGRKKEKRAKRRKEKEK